MEAPPRTFVSCVISTSTKRQNSWDDHCEETCLFRCSKIRLAANGVFRAQEMVMNIYCNIWIKCILDTLQLAHVKTGHLPVFLLEHAC